MRAEIEVVAPDEELAVPYISLVIPDPPNDEVTLKGAFPGASDFAYVMIDDTYVSPFASGLDEIQFHSPPGVTSGMVKVITKGGVSNAVSYAYTPILGADMGSSDLVASADLLPGSGDLASPSSFALVPDNGDDAATIVINGPNLENIKQVLFTVYGFAVESPVTPVSATSIQVVVPDTAITGPITLTFYGAGDQQTPIFHRLPKIEIPMNCVGAVCFFPGSFSISGYGLSTVTAIKYGDAVATAFTVQSDTLINQIQFDVNTPSIYESPTGTPNHFAVTVTSPYRTLTDAFGGAMGCTSDANCAGNATLNKCSIQDDVCATTN